jgi:tetratricopeptide (TPR) repeat protein
MASRKKRRELKRHLSTELHPKEVSVPASNSEQPSCVFSAAYVQTIEQRLTKLDNAVSEKQPWYRTPSVLISFVALVFSFGTTGASIYRTSQQDVHDAGVELRGLIQRLIAVPKDALEIRTKYGYDIDLQQQLLMMLSSESQVIAAQAAATAQKIPGRVTATEYGVLADVFFSQGNYTSAKTYLSLAIESARNSYELTQAKRRFGSLLFTTNKPVEARALLMQSLSLLKTDRIDAEPRDIYLAAETTSIWASGEFSCGNYKEAADKVSEGIALTKRLPNDRGRGSILAQLLSLLRKLGEDRILSRDLESGRHLYQLAMVTPELSPDPLYALSSNAQIEISWARAEMAAGQCEEALQHANASEEIIKQIPDYGTNLKGLLEQVGQLRLSILQNCRPADKR